MGQEQQPAHRSDLADQAQARTAVPAAHEADGQQDHEHALDWTEIVRIGVVAHVGAERTDISVSGNHSLPQLAANI